MKHLNERNTQYKIAKRYGLVVEEEKPVVFYFEQYKSEAKVITAVDCGVTEDRNLATKNF